MLCLQRCPSVTFSQSRWNEHMCYTSALKILLIKHGGVQPFAGKVNASLSSAPSLAACLHSLLTIGTGCQKQPREDHWRGPWDVFLSVNAHTHPLPVRQKKTAAHRPAHLTTMCPTYTRLCHFLTLLPQEHITKHLALTIQACWETNVSMDSIQVVLNVRPAFYYSRIMSFSSFFISLALHLPLVGKKHALEYLKTQIRGGEKIRLVGDGYC